jgi:23S rRNA (pseudouridine1915-N3)-methyltransferase
MKIELWSIGKPNEKIYDAAITDFIKRINFYYAFKLINTPSKANGNAPIAAQLKTEGEQLNSLLLAGDALIILDDKGKSLTTLQLATQFEKYLNLNYKRIIFLIGGAYGIDESIKNKAIFSLSLGALTMPHQLVRLVFAEQFYRICTVLKNEKYHHE